MVPGDPLVQSRLQAAKQLHQAGSLREAEAIYRQILQTDPRQPETLHLVGLLKYQSGDAASAAQFLQYAAELNPDVPECFFNLGLSFAALGRMDEAIAAFDRAIQLRPDYAPAHNAIGNCFREKKNLALAIKAYRKAVEFRGDVAGFWNNLGIALQSDKQPAAAIEALRRATMLKPDWAEAYSNLGNALWQSGDLENAAAVCRQAIKLQPNLSEAHNNLANVLRDLGQYDEAAEVLTGALAHNPQSPQLHWNFAPLLLMKGDYSRGWQEYEWGRRIPEHTPPFPRFFETMWDGSALNGKRILLDAEQGFGDAIQFARYIPSVARRGGDVILRCDPALDRLLGKIPGANRIVSQREAIPDFEVHCPLVSLPRVLQLDRPEDLPWSGPYLTADAADRDKFRPLLAGAKDRKKVGLVWAGGAGHSNDRQRSARLIDFSALAQIPGIWLCSLQKGPPAQEIPPAVAKGLQINDFTDQLQDFADTAAVIDQLDLVISVDTAVLHLAGALGKPAWAVLPFAAEWRWMIGRSDSPWYPTLRLFRQTARGDWTAPIAQIAAALRELP
jgi:tetratricopeptide (TPR) repeat protein